MGLIVAGGGKEMLLCPSITLFLRNICKVESCFVAAESLILCYRPSLIYNLCELGGENRRAVKGSARSDKFTASHQKERMKEGQRWAVAEAVAQFPERSLWTPEVRGSNPDIGKKIFECNCLSILIDIR